MDLYYLRASKFLQCNKVRFLFVTLRNVFCEHLLWEYFGLIASETRFQEEENKEKRSMFDVLPLSDREQVRLFAAICTVSEGWSKRRGRQASKLPVGSLPGGSVSSRGMAAAAPALALPLSPSPKVPSAWPTGSGVRHQANPPKPFLGRIDAAFCIGMRDEQDTEKSDRYI